MGGDKVLKLYRIKINSSYNGKKEKNAYFESPPITDLFATTFSFFKIKQYIKHDLVFFKKYICYKSIILNLISNLIFLQINIQHQVVQILKKTFLNCSARARTLPIMNPKFFFNFLNKLKTFYKILLPQNSCTNYDLTFVIFLGKISGIN